MRPAQSCESRTIHMLPADSRASGKGHCPDEKWVVLDGVDVCQLIAARHVELLLGDLARLDRRVAVLGQVLARRGAVVDAVPLFRGCATKGQRWSGRRGKPARN